MSSLRNAFLLLAGLVWPLAAQTADPAAWASLKRLAPGQSVQVINRKGDSFKGAFASVSEDSIAVIRNGQTVAVSRSEVSRVRVPSQKHLQHTLIGAVIGAAAGVGLGAAGAESLSQTSGGDFANLKPAIICASGGVGALLGAVIGSVIGNRGTTVYRAK